MTDVEKLLSEMVSGLPGVPDGPYRYRPDVWDDWGIIRDKQGVVLQINWPRYTEDEASRHREHGTDPFEKAARHFARCSPDNIKAIADAFRTQTARIAELESENERYREALKWYAEEDRYEYDPTCCSYARTKKRERELERSGGWVLEDNGNVARTALMKDK